MKPIEYINPAGMHQNSAFTQAIAVSGPHRVVYIGGQNAVDASGQIVGKGDLAAQCARIARNLDTVLAAAGANRSHVVRWNIHLVQDQSARIAFEAFQRVWGPSANPPTITVLLVTALAHPDLLAEVDGVAVIPEAGPR